MIFMKKENLFVLLICILIVILFVGVHTSNFGDNAGNQSTVADNTFLNHANDGSAPPIGVGSVGYNSTNDTPPPTEKEMFENVSYNNTSDIPKPEFDGGNIPIEK